MSQLDIVLDLQKANAKQLRAVAEVKAELRALGRKADALLERATARLEELKRLGRRADQVLAAGEARL